MHIVIIRLESFRNKMGVKLSLNIVKYISTYREKEIILGL